MKQLCLRWKPEQEHYKSQWANENENQNIKIYNVMLDDAAQF